MRRSFASIWMSTSSASGSTATVAVEVWMRPLASVSGHALHAVDAALVLQPAVDVAALDERDDFLDAAAARLAQVQHLDLPALALGVARVHPEQVPAKSAASSPPVPGGSRARRSSRRSDPSARAGPWISASRPRHGGLERFQLGLRQLAHVGILQELLRAADLATTSL
jgi:hypothetical protein